MGFALEEAGKALAKGEVPVGAVVVREEQIIARGHNLTELARDSTAHAEMIVLKAAAKTLDAWRLAGTTLYVTLEPCTMCMGAALLSRIDQLVFGAFDPKGGAAGSVFDIAGEKKLNHRIEVVSGVRAAECGEILSSFFVKLRQAKKAEKRE